MVYSTKPTKIQAEFLSWYNERASRDGKDILETTAWSEDVQGQFKAFSQRRQKARQKAHYAKRKAEGKAPKATPRSQLTPDRLTEIRERGRREQARRRNKDPDALRPRNGNETLRSGPVPQPKESPRDPDVLASKYLTEYLKAFPEHRRVPYVRHLTPDEAKAFEAWKHETYPEIAARKKERDASRSQDAVGRPAHLTAKVKAFCAEHNVTTNLEDWTTEDVHAYAQYQKDISNARRRELRVENPGAALERERKYKASEKGKLAARLREQRADVRAYRQQYKRDNVDKCRAWSKAYRERHYEKEKERVRQFLQKYRLTDKSKDWWERYLHEPGYKWYLVNVSARHRNIDMSLTRDEVDAMGIQPCHYCGEDPIELGTRFGVDRVDNEKGYTTENCVSCCTFCNYAKRNLSVDDFLRVMCNVASTVMDDVPWVKNYVFYDPTKDETPCGFAEYEYQAQRRALVFELSEAQFNEMAGQPCEYCHRSDKRSGIDRVDSALGYIEGNCVPCCSVCNRMKLDWDVTLFYCKATQIMDKWGLAKQTTVTSMTT